MSGLLAFYYPLLKTAHIVSVIAWMAGLLYLPRLFVYHCDAPPGSDRSEVFKTMERRLHRAIMTPAMLASWAFGLALVWANPGLLDTIWLPAKLALVVALTGMHGAMGRWRRDFAADRNRRSARFYRVANEVPTALMIAVVALAVIEPF